MIKINDLYLLIEILAGLTFCFGYESGFNTLPMTSPDMYVRFGSKDLPIDRADIETFRKESNIGYFEIVGRCAIGEHFQPGPHGRTVVAKFYGATIYNSEVNRLKCLPLDIDFYESTLPWCTANTDAYTISVNEMLFGGLCYNMTDTRFESIYYTTFKEELDKYTIVKPSGLADATIHKDLKIESLQLFSDLLRSKYEKNEKDNALNNLHLWEKYVKFEWSSIFTVEIFKKLLSSKTSFFNIMWWPNLRDGNWKRFVQTLEEQSKNFTYDIWRGTAGSLYVPKHNDFDNKANEVNATIPTYIWNYLKGRDNDEEVLVVAFNSPFYEFLAEKDVIFCEDVCHKYAWLKSITSTFRYPTFGIMFCCDVHDVNVKHHLENFRYELLTTQNGLQGSNESESISNTTQTFKSD